MRNPIIDFPTENLKVRGCVDTDFRLIVINLRHDHLDRGTLWTDDDDGFPAFPG